MPRKNHGQSAGHAVGSSHRAKSANGRSLKNTAVTTDAAIPPTGLSIWESSQLGAALSCGCNARTVRASTAKLR